MTPIHHDGWIARMLATEPPRPKSLLTTVFGDSLAPHGGTVWLGSLINLMTPFGVHERLLRTTVFRLAQEGWVSSERDGRRSSYSLTASARGRFARAYRRIYAPPADVWDGSWTVVFSTANNGDAVGRNALRKELLWEGYYMIASGLAAHPDSAHDVLDEILERTGMADKVYVCRATTLPDVGHRPLEQLVAEGWNLTEVEDGYRQFLRQFEPLAELLQKAGPGTDAQAFVMRTLLIHAYRRVQLHDPQLPAALLPPTWAGTTAYALTRALYRTLCAASERHLIDTLRKEDPQAPAADAAFYKRLGGLA